jgi:hypothetical protein
MVMTAARSHSSLADLFSGQLEKTIHRNYIRSANLRRWLAQGSRAPVIKEIKELFDKIYVRRTEDHPMAVPMDETMHDEEPELFGTGSAAEATPARIRYEGVMYSRRLTHKGNSNIMFYAHGDTNSLPIPGSIEKIDCSSPELGIVFHVRPFLSSSYPSRDPFAEWPLLRAQIWSTALGASTPVPIGCIHSQLISCNIGDNHQVIIPVSHVRAFLPLFYS